MPTPEQIKKVAFVLGVLVGGYTVYRLFRNTSKPISFKEAVKETVNDVIDIPVKVVEEAKKVADNSPRKKKRAKKKKSEFSKEKSEHPELPDKTIKKIVSDHEKKKSRKKSRGKKSKLGMHKGHKTKKGLSNDQKLKSQEVHEKAYRKRKSK